MTMTDFEVKLIIGGLGFLGGFIPFMLRYIKDLKKETISAEKRFFDQVTSAENQLREDLVAQINELKGEMRELKIENKALHIVNLKHEKRITELEVILLKHNVPYKEKVPG